MYLKIDLNKAFASVNWDFLEAVLHTLNFPAYFINCIMQCIKSSSFSVLVNSEACGYFNSKRGLRQSCPISPYLFSMLWNSFQILLRRKWPKSKSNLLLAEEV